jgi:hypothetical protein
MSPQSVRFGVRSRKLSKRWSVIRWVTKNVSRAPSCFGKHVEPLVPAAFAVVSTHHHALGPRGGLYPSLCVILKEGLCSNSGGINRLMKMKNLMKVNDAKVNNNKQ